MMYDLELESIIKFENLDQRNTKIFPITGFIPYSEGQVVERPMPGNDLSKSYKVESVKDIFFVKSKESVLCRRVIALKEINN